MGGEPVRELTNTFLLELHNAKDASRKPKMTAAEWRELNALKLLKQAHEKKDPDAARAAADELMPFVEVEIDPRNPNLSRSLARDHVAVDAVGDRRKMAERVTRAVEGVQLVMWVPGKLNAPRSTTVEWSPEARVIDVQGEAPRAGMFFKDFKRAVAYKMLFNGIRVCMHCHVLFVPNNPKAYSCSVQHRDAHRMARFRKRKELEAKMKAMSKAARRKKK